MRQNNEAYSTQLLNINPASIDWEYILKDDKVVELLDTAPKDLREQTIELFYKTMIGISLYFVSRKGKDLETIKLHYPKLPTLIKELIKEGVNKGELYAIDCLYSKGNARTHNPATVDIVGSDGVRIYVNTELNHARLYAEYENKLPAYITATADIVMELDKLDGDTPQPQQRKTKQTPSFKSLLLRGDDGEKERIIGKIREGDTNSGKYAAGVYKALRDKELLKDPEKLDRGRTVIWKSWHAEFKCKCKIGALISGANSYLREEGRSACERNFEEGYIDGITSNLGI